MSTLLHIKSSILGGHSQSSQLSDSFVRRWQSANPGHRVLTRDLATTPVAHLDGTRLAALNSAEDERTAAQQAIVDEAIALIAEFRQADHLVLGLPMYNFGIPSQLKAWFDHIARAGVTFEYTANGPRGLVGDKHITLFATRGGVYHANGADYQVPAVKQFFGLLGQDNVDVIYAEGLNMSERREAALAQAHEHIDALLSNLVSAA